LTAQNTFLVENDWLFTVQIIQSKKTWRYYIKACIDLEEFQIKAAFVNFMMRFKGSKKICENCNVSESM